MEVLRKEIEPGARFALISVSDKEGITELAHVLTSLGYAIISTGGTAKALAESGVDVIPVQEITGNPEAFDGRMKTISFEIEAGILFDRSNPEHRQQAAELGIPQIDVVIANFYPFAETIEKEGMTMQDAVESIDVGGPTMVRAAAKNHQHVLVVTDKKDYPRVAQALETNSVTPKLRQELAAKAFAHLSAYDALVAQYFGEAEFPHELNILGHQKQELRYGDNPHQKGILYLDPNSHAPLTQLKRLSGREPSATNITDINAGVLSVSLFNEPAAVIIKHNTPCGIALGGDIAVALQRAINADPESAFGGVVILNQPLTEKAAQVIAQFKVDRKSQMDIIAAPGIAASAHELLREVRKSTGIYTFGKLPPLGDKRQVRFIDGGLIVQSEDESDFGFTNWQVVTKSQPTLQQRQLMEVGWKFIMRIKSNTVIVVDAQIPMTRGIGTGQTSRVRSTRIALEQAGKFAKGAILVSDGFFPFPDSVELASRAGIAVIVQPGGSKNDEQVISAADETGITMVHTYRRAFWH